MPIEKMDKSAMEIIPPIKGRTINSPEKKEKKDCLIY
jgi:hypothetical protein